MRSFLVVQVELVVMGVEFDYHIERWLDVGLNHMKIVDHNFVGFVIGQQVEYQQHLSYRAKYKLC
jgi:hypothetical protein